MAGYTRQSVADIVSGQVIKAEPINNELNQVLSAFNASTGHKHDGTTAEGAYIPTISDTNNYTKVVIDTSNNRINFFTNVGSAAVEQVRLQDGAFVPVTDEDIDLGSSTAEFKDLYIDGVGYIDTLAVHENATITANLTVNGNTTLGSDDSDTVTVNADVASDLIPSADGTYDLGSSTAEWQDLYIDGTANIDSLVADTADIDGGTIDGTVIGNTTAASGEFTTLGASGNLTVGGTAGVTGNTTLAGTLSVTGAAGFASTVTAPNLCATGTSTLSTVDINAGNIDGTVIGASSAAAGSFTTVSTSGQGTFASVDINGGTIDGTTIGATTSCPGTFSSLTATTADINGGTVDGAVIGGSSSAAGTFTDLTSTGTSTHATVDINGGAIDGTTIGGSSAAAITGTTVTANTCFIGNVTGNVTGNLTGNAAGCHTGNFDGTIGATTACPVTATTVNGTVICASTCLDGPLVGNVTGNVTGNITSSGASCFTTLRLTGSMDANSNRITNLADPVSDSDAANKGYVDSAVEGLDVKGSVKAATTANITLSGEQTIDGVSVISGDRVLVKDQSTASENGVYVADSSTWSRADDADTFDKHSGAFFFVEEGTTNADNGFVSTVDTGGTLDTTDITFVQFSGAGQITAGTGLTKSGNTINVVTADSGRIVTNADSIDLATTGVSAGTYKSVTTDVYGRITGGTNPTTLSGYGITDAYTSTCTDTLLNAKVDLAGDTMTGDLAMGSNSVTSTATPATDDTLTRKGYVDTKLPLAGGTMTGAIDMGSNKITTTYTPTDNADLTTKTYVDGILGSATEAATSATNAATSETNAATSETNAANSATAAASSATCAAASYDSFDDRYLGDKTSDPSVDNDGDGLLTGALYWNTTDNALKVYTGSAWASAAFTLGDALTCIQEDTSPVLGGNLNAGTNCIYGTGAVCVSNLYGTLTGNVTGNVTGTVSDISNHDTDALTEGASNLYYTDARVDSHLSGGTGVTYTSGAIAIGQAVGTGNNVCFNSVCVAGNPTLACQLATKEYVDTIAAAGIHYHDPVRVESPDTAGNLSATYDNGTAGVGATLTNNGTQAALVIDGVTLNTNDRVLIYSQTNQYENGIYTVTNTGSASTNWVLTRATDADSYGASDQDALGEGDAFFVKEGDTGAGELYVMNRSGVITFGTTPITFTVVAETAVYGAGNGLTLDGTTFNVGAGTGVTVNANDIAIGQAVGTSDNVTFNNITGAVLCGTTCVKAGHLCATTCGLATCCFHAPKVCATTCMASPCFAGNATSATSAAAWTTARTLCICGDVTGSASVDGSGNVNLLTAVADDSHNHTVANVDGLATCLSGKAATNGSTSNNFSGAVVCGATCVESPYLYSTANICAGVCLRAATCLNTPIVCGSSCVKSGTICAGSFLKVAGRCICNSAGDYGSISVVGGDLAWPGYSIENAWVFMGQPGGSVGIYNDATNEWALCAACNGAVSLYHDGTGKFQTTTYGSYTAGCHCATSCLVSPTICGATCVHSDIICGITAVRTATVCATDFNSTSDCRCKDNITTVENAYCKIGQIRGVNYNWKDSGKYTMGVVAQEVEEAFPELVTTDDDGYKSVNYNGLVGALIETVKCLQGKVEELENGSKG